MKTKISTSGIVLLICLTMNLFAEHVKTSDAINIGKNFYWENSRDTKAMAYDQIKPELYSTATFNGIPLYYVFNINLEDGFVIIAADDRVVPVLGFNFTGSFNDKNLPPAMEAWLQSFRDQIAQVIEQELAGDESVEHLWEKYKTFNPSPVKSKGVDPLVAAKWSQEKYYNAFCPSDPAGFDNHALVGCVAVAMGQIMKCFGYPVQGSGNHAYTPATNPGYGVQSADFHAANYDYAVMHDSLSTYDNQVAELLYHCGVSVDMDYGPVSSGVPFANTIKIRDAFVGYFNYSSDAELLFKNNYSNLDWQTMLIAQLDQQRPVYYQGMQDADAGHAFVCDGYLQTDYFHFNWGWSGEDDGFFYLNNLNPKTHNFTLNQSAIFNLYPPKIIYVDKDANGLNNGKCWRDAFVLLQDAIDAAVQGDSIWVAEGKYAPTGNGMLRLRHFALKNNVKIYGGFKGDENPGTFDYFSRNFLQNETILDGEKDRYHVVKNMNINNTALLDGFSITGGRAVDQDVENQKGAGMYNDASNPRIINCRFYDNFSNAFGAGMFNLNSNPEITNCIFSGNETTDAGGGMFNHTSSPVIVNCLINGNSAINGGAIYNLQSFVQVINTTISGNKALTCGGGICNHEQLASLVILKNCILWGNEVMNDQGGFFMGHQLYNEGMMNKVNFLNSCVQTGGNFHVYGNGMIFYNLGCIFSDPWFVFPEPASNAPNSFGNYRLQIISPAIDAGDNGLVPAGVEKDLDWNLRISWFNVDLGAYESPNDCHLPKNLSAIEITENAAKLIWTPGGSEGEWSLEWGIAGFVPGSGVMVTGLNNHQYLLNILSPATDYDFYVQAVCAGGFQSLWAGPHRFSTQPAQQVSQLIILDQGWSGVSSYLEQTNCDVVQMFSPVVQELVILLNMTQVYWPGQNINEIGLWKTTQGYKIKMADDEILNVCGIKTFNRLLSLSPGWHIIPVLCENNVATSAILKDPGVMIAKEISGPRVYWPAMSISSLDVLEPGKAYMVYLTAPATIAFPSKGGEGLEPDKEELNSPWNKVIRTGSTHVISISSFMADQFDEGDLIGAFNTSGVNVGLAAFSKEGNVLVIYGDDPYTTELDGMMEGEEIQFKVYRQKTGEVAEINPTFNPAMPNTENYFVIDGISAIEMLTRINEQTTVINFEIYPNPVSENLNIRFNNKDSGNFTIEIMNLPGEMVCTPVNTSNAQVSINLSHLAEGCYLVRVSNGIAQTTSKVIVQR
ncbi:MAG: C10 family peptidase [Bacteroidales bacterium]|nr:C10 family peptidase [Bacteroidales bacterium]